MQDEIRSRVLAVLAEPSLLPTSGLLFHGTAEPFDGRLYAVGIDGLLWFAHSPLVAQSYIPSSGISAIVGRPHDYKLDERIWPNPGFWTDYAVNDLGYALPDVEYSPAGRAVSWSIREPWPTYRECLRKIAELGYEFKGPTEQVKQLLHDKTFHVMPKAWRKVGRVFVTLADQLRFSDFSTGESDLTEYAHLRLDRFRRALAEGWDGVIIDDFAQSDDMGNIGHRSWGLFQSAVRNREFLVYDAVHREMGGARSHLTDEFTQFAASLEAAAAPCP